jgi:hypothetical protein
MNEKKEPDADVMVMHEVLGILDANKLNVTDGYNACTTGDCCGCVHQGGKCNTELH